MRILFTLFLAVGICAFLPAQSSKDATIPITATVSFLPNSIRLDWPNPEAADLLIIRRTKGQTGAQWIQRLNVTASTLTTYTDNNVVAGQTYEYAMQRLSADSLYSFGYAHVAMRPNAPDSRGNILVIVDSTTADAIGVELVRMKNDMRGDGWIATPYKIGPSATVASVKQKIVDEYNADPQNMKAVLLIGDVPIPYSGDANWDGHPDHAGAWPADSYYADVNGVWTDTDINDVSPSRAANVNVPGDGKFDQSFIPTPVELQVGRIDFRKINAPAFGEPDAIGLIKRYLDKDHAWRTGAYKVQNKALVDDNFGYFGGEAFASNGYRNAYPLVGEANVEDADFFDNTNPGSYLLGYGCGGGWYQGASGVGSSDNFATDTVNIVFANLFGSYFGDWDYESNPFMPAALASRGGILTCSWAGRPYWFNQALASGETIGYCHKETQNAAYNNGFIATFGESGAHTALLGDPTLRAHVVDPPQSVLATPKCDKVEITWTASDQQVEGYHVYRSASNDGPYTRLSVNPVVGTAFVDNNPVPGDLYYQVRAIQLQSSPGGGVYFNNSVGPIVATHFVVGTAPVISLQDLELNCTNTSVNLEVNADQTVVNWSWTGPNGFTSSDTMPSVNNPGNYSVVVTAENGCTAEGSLFVSQNSIAPVASVISSNALTCTNQTTSLTVSSVAQLTPGAFIWSNGETTDSIQVNIPGVYTVTVTSSQNGCTATAQTVVTQNTIPPAIDLPASVTYTCANPCVTLPLSNQNQYDYYLEQDLVPAGEPLVFCTTNLYSLLVVDQQNGCSTDWQIDVTGNITAPDASIGGLLEISCDHPTVQLMGSSNGANVTFTWDGPGINPGNIHQQSPTVGVVGVYTLTVTDDENGCSSTAVASVTANVDVPVAVASGGLITCTNPLVELSSAGSSTGPDYSYSWTGPGGFSSNEANPQTSFAGSYVLTVSNTAGCMSTATAEVTEDTQLPHLMNTIGNLDCNHNCIYLTWAPMSPGFLVEPDTICAPGVYDIVLSNSNNGCSQTVTITISDTPPLTGAFEPEFLDCDGTITVTVDAMGGMPPYSYNWSNGSTLNSALYLLNGTPIFVKITDAAGCTWDSDTLNVVAPPPLSVVPVIQNESAPGASNGSISLQITGGVSPSVFQWSNGANTQNISGLTGGNYTVTITDAATGCTAEYTFTVSTTSGIFEANANLSTVELSPNPTSGMANLIVTARQSTTCMVRVHDPLGRLILEKTGQESNSWNFLLDMSQQAAGVYQVSVLSGNETLVRRLVVAR